MSKGPRNCSYDIWAMKKAAFCPCPPKKLPEAKLKSVQVLALAEELSGHRKFDSVVKLSAATLTADVY